MVNKEELIKEKKIRLARSNFWEFCKLLDPKFYFEDNKYLKKFCQILQDLYQKKLINPKTGKPYLNLITSIPRRWGKSYTYQMWEAWILGLNYLEVFITISYNTDLATDFSTAVRNLIMQEKNEKISYRDIFPNTQLKQGSKSVLKWRLERSPRNNYVGTGLNGMLTGKGASILLVDDLIRNAKEAYNEQALEDHYKFWTGSVLQVVENNGLKIVNFTRWRNEDLIGKILNGPTKDDWYVYTVEACVNDIMQCPPNVMTLEHYRDLEKEMDPLIFRANYHQETIDLEGKRYDNKTYDKLPEKFDYIKCVIDTADTGNDYTCIIIFGQIGEQAFILDVLHTQDDQSKTENKIIEMLINNNVDTCIIEGNNGGKQFAELIRRNLENRKIYNINIKTFHQAGNKETRIEEWTYKVNKNIFMPITWSNWRSFYKEIYGFQRQGKAKHDDAADCLSLVAEEINKKKTGLYRI